MKTFLAQNQFISDSVVGIPAADTAVASSDLQPRATAETIADPDGGYMGHRLSPALGTSVGSAAIDLCQEPMAASHLDQIHHIHEIFHWVRKLMSGDQGFMLDETLFMAEVEEMPLFVRDGEHLKRWNA